MIYFYAGLEPAITNKDCYNKHAVNLTSYIKQC